MLWAVLVAAGGWYFLARVLPAISRRINPLYAAETIERSRPSLKNSLVNFLLLRRDARELKPIIYRAIEYRAAADLSQVNVDTAVDHGRVIRLGYVLLALVAASALYLVFSPKNPLVSFGRVMWPWARIDAPTRVRIVDIEPGDVKSFRGEFVTVSAEISGLKEGESARVYYSSADGQSVDEAVPMARAQGEYRFRAALPPGSLGLQQDLDYYLAAGDARSRIFKIQAQVSPVVNVDRVEYHYPQYTGIADRVVQGEGDLRAPEGTRVDIRAVANEDIARASIDLGCAGLHAVRMAASGNEARGGFTLRLRKDDPTRAEDECYQLRFTDPQGRENRNPIRHRIEVIRDLPPEIELLSPKQEEVAIPENGQLEIRLRAVDPDYALRRVALKADRKKESLRIAPLLDRPRPGDPHKGEFVGVYLFQPSRLGLKAGDQVTYWGEAEDSKYLSDEEPEPNRSQTAKHFIRILGADARTQQPPHEGQPNQQPQQGQQGRDQRNERPQYQGPQDQEKPQGPKPDQQAGKPQDQQQKPDQHDKPQPGQQQGQQQGKTGQPGEQKQGQGESDQQGDAGKSASGNQPGGQGRDKQADGQQGAKEPIDPETNPGDAFDKLSKFFKDQQRKEGKQPDDEAKQDQMAQNDQPQGGAQGQQQDQGGQKGQQSGQQKQSAGDQQGQQKGQPQGGEQGQQGDQKGQQGGGQEKPMASQQQGQQGAGQEKQAGGQQQGDQKGQQASGQEKQAGGQQQGDQKGQQGGGQEKPMAGQQQGQQGAGQEKPMAGQQQGQQGAGQEKQAGGQQQGDQKGQQGGGQEKQVAGKQQGQRDATGPKKGEGDQEQSAAGGQQGQGNKDRQGGQQTAERREAGGEPGKQGSGDKTAEQRTASGQASGSEKAKPEAGQGAQTAQDRQPAAQKPEGQQMAQAKPEAKGGDPEGSGGKAGAGKPSDDKAGNPSPQEGNQPRDKKAGKPDSPNADSRHQEEGQSPSNSPKDSDAKGETSGDRSGGGEKGGGQKANQSGTGSAGTHTAAEQGGSKSEQKGDGEAGQRAGNQMQSKSPTGSTAQQQGQSSRSGKPGESQTGKSSNQAGQAGGQGPQPSSQDQASNQQQGQRGGQSSGNPMGGGQAGEQNGAAPPPKPELVGADDPDLRYANKQTDLTLRHLREELAKNKPNPELLNQLGWTRDDLEKFYRRWTEMKREAQQEGPAGPSQKKLDQALKSLGLRPQGTQLKGGATPGDQMQNLHESIRTDPPPEWREYLKAYTEGVSGKK